MQARSLRIGEAHPSQVLKVVADAASHSVAAFLLADSSCLLFSLSSPQWQPRSIPPPCTDACFLRLRTRRLPSVASFHPVTEAYQSNSKVKKRDDAGNGAAGKASIDEEGRSTADGSFFLTVLPGDQKSSTLLKAWQCLAPPFPQVTLRCERFSSLQVNTLVARLDVPHGLTVKIAASVNVLVVFSPSSGKILIMSGRVSRSHREPQSSGINGFTDHNNDAKAEYANTVKPPELCLIKCAVIDCNSPVYYMHLSLQYLFLGQSGGLRIWHLRTLVGLAKFTKKNSDTNRDGRPCNIQQRPTDHSYLKVSREMTNKDVAIIPPYKLLDTNALGCNDSISKSTGIKVSNNLKAGVNCAVPTDKNKGYGRLGDWLEGEEDKVLCLSKTLCRDSGERCSEGIKHTTKENGMEGVDAKLSLNVSENGLWLKEAGYQARNALLHLQVPDVEDQFLCSSPSCRDAASRSSSICVSASSLSSLCSLSSVALTASCSTLKMSEDEHFLMRNCGILCKHCKDKRTIGSFFVPFGGVEEKSASRRAKSQHAICVQSLSERDHVVLDSYGKLYLLKLDRFPASHDERREPKTSDSVPDIFLKPLDCPMRMKLMTSLPLSQQSGALGMRKFWISDGSYSIYVLSLYQRVGEEEQNKDVKVEPKEFTVTEAVFMPERIHAFTATSESSVMVLTQGSITAYSMAES